MRDMTPAQVHEAWEKNKEWIELTAMRAWECEQVDERMGQMTPKKREQRLGRCNI